MVESILSCAAGLVGAIYLLSPFVAHTVYRFASRSRFDAVSLDSLPDEIREEFGGRISEFASLGFEPLGCFDSGSLVSETQSYVAYFSHNERIREPKRDGNARRSRVLLGDLFPVLANGRSIDTNTNGILPVMPGNPDVQVFRFPAVENPRTLLKHASPTRREVRPRAMPHR